MAITLDGIYVDGQKVTFAPEDILTGDASAYTEEIGTAVEAWMEENVTGGEQVTDTTLTLPGVPADAEVTGNKFDELKEDLNTGIKYQMTPVTPTVIESTYIRGDTGASAYGNRIWYCTDYIDIPNTVKGGLVIFNCTFYSYVGCAFYDANKQYISGISGTSLGITGRETREMWVQIPATAKYFRCTLYYNDYTAPSDFGIYIQNSYDIDDTNENVRTNTANIFNLSDVVTVLSGRVTSLTNVFVIGHEKNYLNTETSVEGYLNANGTIHDTTLDWMSTDFIDVSDCDYVTASCEIRGSRQPLGTYYWLNYDESKAIVGSQINNNITPYQIPSGVKYIRFAYHGEFVKPMLEKGNTITDYEPFVTIRLVKDAPYITPDDVVTNHYKDLKWAVFGDSLTEKNSRAVKSYYDYIAEELGCSIVNYGASGTGYARSNSNFMTRMLNVDPTKFDVLTIFGSLNDAGAELDIGDPTDTGTSTLCGCINTTIDNFYTVAPYKVLGLVTPCPWASVSPNNTWGNDYADAIIAIAKRRGIPYLDLFRMSGIRPWAGQSYLEQFYKEGDLQDAGTHPNSLGHKVFLYPHFREFIKTLY